MIKKPTQNQFSKYAKQYGQNNIIQQIVSKALIRDIKFAPKNILELGCGSGQVFKHISWSFDRYKAIDSSNKMCLLHPKSKNLEVVCLDFDSDEFFAKIKNEKYDIVISSSALQWSKNINKLVKNISKITKNINVVLFTANTFQAIYNITKQKSPILTTNEIKTVFKNILSVSLKFLIII
jgi:malonyl-CoA O-methyltransferase